MTETQKRTKALLKTALHIMDDLEYEIKKHEDMKDRVRTLSRESLISSELPEIIIDNYSFNSIEDYVKKHTKSEE